MSEEKRSRIKDLWQLHLPLVVVLALCTFATVVEYGRAQQGVDRAWVYTIQWPIIGLFAVVVWNRYRKHGSITRSISNYFRSRAARFEAEAIAEEERARAEAAGETVEVEEVDPDEVAWREHVRRLHELDPPGGPPSERSPGR